MKHRNSPRSGLPRSQPFSDAFAKSHGEKGREEARRQYDSHFGLWQPKGQSNHGVLRLRPSDFVVDKNGRYALEIEVFDEGISTEDLPVEQRKQFALRTLQFFLPKEEGFIPPQSATERFVNALTCVDGINLDEAFDALDYGPNVYVTIANKRPGHLQGVIFTAFSLTAFGPLNPRDTNRDRVELLEALLQGGRDKNSLVFSAFNALGMMKWYFDCLNEKGDEYNLVVNGYCHVLDCLPDSEMKNTILKELDGLTVSPETR